MNMYWSMGSDELQMFLAEIGTHINQRAIAASLSIGDLEMQGSICVRLIPGNRLSIGMMIEETINKSARGITVTINEKD